MPFITVEGDGVDRAFRKWEPNARQADFVKIPDSVFEAFYGGAAFGGKSELLLMLPILRRWHENPRFHGIIFRRTFPQLEESLIPRSKEYYESVGGEYNSQLHLWSFPSGATIRFSYMLRRDDARDHDTAEYNYVAFDELTHFEEFQYLYLTSRVRTSDASLPAIVRSASNPGNIGHGWVRARFIEPARKGYTIIVDKASGSKRIFIPAWATDNVVGMQNDPNYINRLWLLPTAERKAKLEGDWWTFSGAVFGEWREEHLEGEPENAIHVVRAFDVPLWWPRIVAIDWGKAAMTWIGWAAVAPNRRAYLYREYAHKNKYISEWAADFARITAEAGETITQIVIDPSSRQQRGDPKSILDQFCEHSGFIYDTEHRLGIVGLADNDRISGKMLMHEYLRWEPKPARIVPQEGFNLELSQRIYRNYGEKAYREYCKLFLPEEPEDNLPKLQVFPSCKEFIRTVPLCVYKDATATDTAPEDVREFDGDDPYDGGRYLIKAIDHYIETGAKAAEERSQLDAIIQKFQQDQNWTAYYRRMEKLEHEQGNTPTRIRAYHRGRRH